MCYLGELEEKNTNNKQNINFELPFAVPSTALVEKKAKFLVSKMLSLEHSVPRYCGSDSPVKAELSTCINT